MSNEPEWLEQLRKADPDATEYHMTQLIHADPTKGENYRLYLYGADGYHGGTQWFTSGKIKYPDEQITAEQAKFLAEDTMRKGHEVRITDAGDFLVFHAVNGRQVHPPENVDFWSQV
jgi:hypothetical protein